MKRTTIVLPEPLKRQTVKKAREIGVSFAEYVRKTLEIAVNETDAQSDRRKRRAAIHAMLRFREESPSGPPDLTARLDDYVYGGKDG